MQWGGMWSKLSESLFEFIMDFFLIGRLAVGGGGMLVDNFFLVEMSYYNLRYITLDEYIISLIVESAMILDYFKSLREKITNSLSYERGQCLRRLVLLSKNTSLFISYLDLESRISDSNGSDFRRTSF